MFWVVSILPFLSCCLYLEKMKHICQYKCKDPDEEDPQLQLPCALPAQEPALGISFLFHFQSSPTCCIAASPFPATNCSFLARLY